MAELELKEVSYFYESGGKRIDILDKASYSFEKGTLYTIVGPSGSGKTTTLTLAGALEEPKSGCVCFEGKDIREIGYTRYRNSKIGIVFQGFYLDETRNLIDNVSMPCGYAGVPAKERNKRAETLLKEFGLFSERKKRPSQISGGQQQRAAIARALVNHPRYLFADEPTGNLDEENTRRVMELFQELNQKGIGILMVTHDTAVAECAQRIVKMEQGILVSQSV